ncbi:DUF6146 family protein [Lutimonas sp.]|uniref:DUF6146 family protein n=1 Tax=Lutimonas sp. TaxID=1872403 RepID=UPI003D9B12EB
MKNIVFIVFSSMVLFACGANKQSVDQDPPMDASVTVDTIRIENKELEYEITIMEIGFESWLATQRSPDYFTQKTLESKNLFYVTEWNRRVMMPHGYNSLIYEQQIFYDPKLDYGMEVNYLLYMYFQFFEKKYKQKLY